MKRSDDYSTRRQHLADLSDNQLEERFWSLVGQLVDPLLELGRENTTPAIERSVLLRMGFSSLEAKELVNLCVNNNLLGHGAGNIVYRYARETGIGIRDAGIALTHEAEWDKVAKLFNKSKENCGGKS